jgi:hypothetical protein
LRLSNWLQNAFYRVHDRPGSSISVIITLKVHEPDMDPVDFVTSHADILNLPAETRDGSRARSHSGAGHSVVATYGPCTLKVQQHPDGHMYIPPIPRSQIMPDYAEGAYELLVQEQVGCSQPRLKFVLASIMLHDACCLSETCMRFAASITVLQVPAA